MIQYVRIAQIQLVVLLVRAGSTIQEMVFSAEVIIYCHCNNIESIQMRWTDSFNYNGPMFVFVFNNLKSKILISWVLTQNKKKDFNSETAGIHYQKIWLYICYSIVLSYCLIVKNVPPLPVFFSVTNVGISPQNFLTFSFNSFATLV